MTRLKVTALIAGAGRSQRMGKVNKILVDLGGMPVIERTVRALAETGRIDHHILLVREEDLDRVNEEILPGLVENFPDQTFALVQGGEERMDTIRKGLDALDDDTDLVLIQDGARPFLDPDLVEGGLDRMEEGDLDGCIAAVPVTDTIKRVNDRGEIRETPDRAQLYRAQTPQIFRKEALLAAYDKPLAEGERVTDDAQMLERIGRKVAIYPGHGQNIKLTRPEDLAYGRYLLMEDTHE